MSDQFDFTNDLVAWDDWLQQEELQQPLCIGNLPPGRSESSQRVLPDIVEDPFVEHGPQLDNAFFMDTDNDLDIDPLGFAGPSKGYEQSPVPLIESRQTSEPGTGHGGQLDAMGGGSEIPVMPNSRLVYMKTTCASCKASLDNSELHLNIAAPNLYCSRDKSTTHLQLVCRSCLMKFQSLQELEKHCTQYYHASFRCAVPGCASQLVPESGAYYYHFAEFHPEYLYKCSECGLGFDKWQLLDNHGARDMHNAYVCGYPGCSSGSTRLGDLNRHQLTHKKVVARYPCIHCRKYRGGNGFTRRDHLRQHVRNYHHIDADTQDSNVDDSPGYSCSFEGCDKTESNAFETEKLLKVHLKKEHPSPYQCSYPGCHRIGTNGWMRERDMVKHMKKDHDKLIDLTNFDRSLRN